MANDNPVNTLLESMGLKTENLLKAEIIFTPNDIIRAVAIYAVGHDEFGILQTKMQEYIVVPKKQVGK